MNFILSDFHKEKRAKYRATAEAVVKPLAMQIDEEERYPSETIPKIIEAGFFGIPFPKEYGGQGSDYLDYAIAVEELGRVCATTSVITSAQTSLSSGPIFMFGTEEQKQKYLVPLCKGETVGAFGLTEPNAGTDASMQETTAVLEGDHYILNGSKKFITNSAFADTYIILAMTDKSKGTKGITAFIVEKSYEGFTYGDAIKKMGIRASSTRELFFNNVKVPKENMLGKEGEGFKVAMMTLDAGRIGVAAQALGIAQGAFDETVKYVKERVQFGKTISQFQNTQFVLADLSNRIEAARLMVYRAANLKDQHEAYSVAAAHAKLFASETAMAVTTKCVQLMGGNGYVRDYGVERMMRDAKITEIYEGTSEVQRMVISGSILR